jgi:hypothetical protein
LFLISFREFSPEIIRFIMKLLGKYLRRKLSKHFSFSGLIFKPESSAIKIYIVKEKVTGQ